MEHSPSGHLTELSHNVQKAQLESATIEEVMRRQASLEFNKSLVSALRDLQAKVSKLEEERNSLQRVSNALQDELTKARDIYNHRADQIQSENYDDYVKSVKATYQHGEVISALRKKTRDTNRRCDEYKKQLKCANNVLKQTRDELEYAVKAIGEEKDKLTNVLATQNERFRALQREVDEMRVERDSARLENVELHKKIETQIVCRRKDLKDIRGLIGALSQEMTTRADETDYDVKIDCSITSNALARMRSSLADELAQLETRQSLLLETLMRNPLLLSKDTGQAHELARLRDTIANKKAQLRLVSKLLMVE